MTNTSRLMISSVGIMVRHAANDVAQHQRAPRRTRRYRACRCRNRRRARYRKIRSGTLCRALLTTTGCSTLLTMPMVNICSLCDIEHACQIGRARAWIRRVASDRSAPPVPAPRAAGASPLLPAGFVVRPHFGHWYWYFESAPVPLGLVSAVGIAFGRPDQIAITASPEKSDCETLRGSTGCCRA